MENNQSPNPNPNPQKTEQPPAKASMEPVVHSDAPGKQATQPTEPPKPAESTQQSSVTVPPLPAETPPQHTESPAQPSQTSAMTAGLTAAPTDAQLNAAVEAEKKQQNLVMLEAALYVAGRPLDVNEMCSVLTTRSKKKVVQLAKELIQLYASRNGPVEILELKDERFVMQVKAEFTPLVKRLVNRPLLSSGPLKTLSYIAYRQPITSKRVIEVRGQHAYGHVKMLKEMGLVAVERNGRALVLKTTDYFADYFGLTMDTSTLKRDLKRIFGAALKDEPHS